MSAPEPWVGISTPDWLINSDTPHSRCRRDTSSFRGHAEPKHDHNRRPRAAAFSKARYGRLESFGRRAIRPRVGHHLHPM